MTDIVTSTAVATSDPLANPELASGINIQGLTKTFSLGRKSVQALSQVDLGTKKDSFLSLLGPSGCGKSTLLKAVGGFIKPTSGSIELDGRPVTGPGPQRMVVFQEFDQLPPWKTVKDNIMFPLLASKLAGKAEAAQRALYWIDKVGLGGFGDAYPHTLSGGMKQRVAIARALAMQPDILLMDEPFAALDALTRRKMQEELETLWQELRFTLLFVTHSIEEALVVGNRILLLSPHPGRVRAELNSHQFSLLDSGGAEFQAASRRIHGLLFGREDLAAGSVQTPEVAAPKTVRLAAGSHA
jgi:NitT/TauT family transport system ATP-binding protein